MDPAQVGLGVIQGGWGYVWVVYAATWLCLSGYVLSLHLRLRAEARRAPTPARETP
jgi:hypothetical protein